MADHGKRYNAETFINAVPGSGGLFTVISQRVGCHWHTVKSWYEKSATFAQAVESERESIDDLAESTLIKAMKDGDTTTARWWLERRRKAIFAARQEITGADGKDIVIKWSMIDSGDDS